MESDCYVKLSDGKTVDDLRAALTSQYQGETFVKVPNPAAALAR